MRRSKGYRTKTRKILRRKPRDRGKIALGRLLHVYNMGDRVRIMINPAVQKGMPHRRYQGAIGTVTEKRGRSYVLHVGAVNGSIRTIISRPEHILPMVEAS